MKRLAKIFRILSFFALVGTLTLFFLFIVGYILKLPTDSIYATMVGYITYPILFIDLVWVLFVLYLIKKEIYIEI